jgi:D-alanyl-D-alanine-carboxypeptidase/D-alanyl-D-alanine-endopeptidase
MDRIERARTPLLWLGVPAVLLGRIDGLEVVQAAAAIAVVLGLVLTVSHRGRGWLRGRRGPAPSTRLLDATPPGAELAPALRERLASRRLVPRGCDVAAVATLRGERALVVHGSGALGPDDAVEIGSLTKVFTGILLADLAQEGLVGLDDPIGRFLPGAPPRVAAITLLDLSTHTSGLPRLPAALLVRALAIAPPDPYAGWDGPRLERALRGVRVRRSRRWRYSNLGGGLLGHVLARAAGQEYDALVRTRICLPLGMTQTGIDPPAPLVQGHDRAGLPAAPWHLAALAGAGGLRSTPRDVERFLAAQLAPETVPITGALEAAQEPRRDAGRGMRIGLGWMVRPAADGRGTLHWHDGATGGFSAFLGFSREDDAGAALLMTATAGLTTSPRCLRLLDEIRGERAGPEDPRSRARTAASS